mgnify:CR=1 FL=1
MDTLPIFQRDGILKHTVVLALERSITFMPRKFEGKSYEFFIQPASLSAIKRKTVQFGIVSKFSGVNFKVDTAFDNAREPIQYQPGNRVYMISHSILCGNLVLYFGSVGKISCFTRVIVFRADLTNSQLHRATDNFSIGGALRFNASKKVKPINYGNREPKQSKMCRKN